MVRRGRGVVGGRKADRGVAGQEAKHAPLLMLWDQTGLDWTGLDWTGLDCLSTSHLLESLAESFDFSTPLDFCDELFLAFFLLLGGCGVTTRGVAAS